MNVCILLALVSAAAPKGQGADKPTHVLRPMLSQGSGPLSYEDTPPPQPIAGDILWDQLDMARNCTYTTDNGNACAGVRALGGLYGLQLCDDFVLDAECTITEVTGAFLTFFGAPPAGGANVTFYQDAGCRPLDAFFAADCHAVTVPVPFRDCLFGLQGMYVTATLNDGGITLPPGRWFVDIQPEDETGNGDWYYQVRDNANVPTGCDSHMRDSRPNDPCCTQGQTGYGFSNWTSAGAAGFGPGDAAFQIVGKCGGAAACKSDTVLKASCRFGSCKLVGKLINAVPGSDVTFCMDDGIRCLDKRVNDRGKAKAAFANVGSGLHTIDACNLRANTSCEGTESCAQEDCRCLYAVTQIWRRGDGSGCGYALGQTRSWTGRHCPTEGVPCDAKNGRSCDRILYFNELGDNGCCAKLEWAGCTSIAPAATGLNVAGCP